MVGAEGLFSDLKHSLEDPLCVCVFALQPVDDAQVLEGLSYAGIVGAIGLFLDRKRTSKEPFRVGVLALSGIHDGQTVDGLSHVRMVAAEGLFVDCKRALEDDSRPLGHAKLHSTSRFLTLEWLDNVEYVVIIALGFFAGLAFSAPHPPRRYCAVRRLILMARATTSGLSPA
jgi:hypothetical protein